MRELLACKTRAEAAIWFVKEAERMLAENPEDLKNQAEAENILRYNIGYLGGYYNAETQKKLVEMGFPHPGYAAFNAASTRGVKP